MKATRTEPRNQILLDLGWRETRRHAFHVSWAALDSVTSKPSPEVDENSDPKQTSVVYKVFYLCIPLQWWKVEGHPPHSGCFASWHLLNVCNYDIWDMREKLVRHCGGTHCDPCSSWDALKGVFIGKNLWNWSFILTPHHTPPLIVMSDLQQMQAAEILGSQGSSVPSLWYNSIIS